MTKPPKKMIKKLGEADARLERTIQMKTHNFCPAPFRQLCINPHGELSPCCMVNDPGDGFGKLTEDIGGSLQELKKQKDWKKFLKKHIKNEMPTLCEDACGIHYPSEYHNQWQWAESEGWKHKTHNVKRADIAFSNLCNLSCTMCSASFSSEWIKISSKLYGKIPFSPWNFSETQVIELANEVSSCDIVNIKGGEPFFNPRLKIFLKELADKNLNVHLPILTNGTVIDDEALEQFSRFNVKPTYVVSLETTDNNLYKFIRGGKYSFDDVSKNVNYVKTNYPKLLIKANYVLGAWNIDNFAKDMENLRAAGIDDCNILVIHDPIEQSIKIVNYNVRNKWIEEFEKDKEANPNFYKTMIKDGWDKMLVSNMQTLPHNTSMKKERLLRMSNRYINIRNRMQNLNFDITCITDLVPNYIENTK